MTVLISERQETQYLFDGVVLAGGATPVGVLVVQNIQGCLSLFEFQGLDLSLEFIELLLQMLALLHVLHSASKRTRCVMALATVRHRTQGLQPGGSSPRLCSDTPGPWEPGPITKQV